MRVAFGMKSHSGWAVLVVLGQRHGRVVLVDRRRIELADRADAAWAKQPYHAAAGSSAAKAHEVVQRGIAAARRLARREMRAALARAQAAGHTVTACGVLTGAPMPEWNVDEILAVHFRMHQAEGALFQNALVDAAGMCGMQGIPVPEKQLLQHAEKALGAAVPSLVGEIAGLGKSCGPPWGKDHKEAALAALIVLQRRGRRRNMAGPV